MSGDRSTMMTFCFSGNSDSWRTNRDGGKITSRRVMERNRGRVSCLRAFSRGRAQTQGRPPSTDGDLVRVKDGDGLGGFASGRVRLLLQDVLAAIGSLDRDGTVAAHASTVSGQAARSRQARLVSRARRLQFGESSAGWAKTGPNPT